MKLVLKSGEDLTGVIQDLKDLNFKSEYGFEEKFSNFYHKTYRVNGEPYYVRSNPFTKNVYVIKIINPSREEEDNLPNDSGHSDFFRRDTVEADKVFDLDLDYDVLALLERVNLISWSDKVVRDYIVDQVKKNLKSYNK